MVTHLILAYICYFCFQRIQADEYYPRMIESFNTALFTSNPPVQASCGSTCSMVRTKAGHVSKRFSFKADHAHILFFNVSNNVSCYFMNRFTIGVNTDQLGTQPCMQQ